MASAEQVSLVGALLSLGPAVIAVGGIVVNNWLGSRGTRDRAARETLRLAAAAHISAIEVFVDHGWDLEELLREKAGQDRRDEEFHACRRDWTKVRATGAVLRLSGPHTVAEQAAQLRQLAGGYYDKLRYSYTRARGLSYIRLDENTEAGAEISNLAEELLAEVERFETSMRERVGYTDGGRRKRPPSRERAQG
jgi:hypothetical protein